MNSIKILSVKELCLLLNCSKATLYRWEKNGDLPFKKIKIGKSKVGYRFQDVFDYIENQTSEMKGGE